jgi:hypothetical protein
MASNISASITRRSMVAGLALSASPIALAGADTASAQAKQTTPAFFDWNKDPQTWLGRDGAAVLRAVINRKSESYQGRNFCISSSVTFPSLSASIALRA